MNVDDILTFTSEVIPNSVAATITFDHGDGTIDPRATATAYYEAIGTYEVTMLWELGGLNGSVICGTVEVVADDSAADFDSADYIGQTLAAAKAIAAVNGLTARLVKIDGESLPVTADYRSDRVNFALVHRIVTEANIG